MWKFKVILKHKSASVKIQNFWIGKGLILTEFQLDTENNHLNNHEFITIE